MLCGRSEASLAVSTAQSATASKLNGSTSEKTPAVSATQLPVVSTPNGANPSKAVSSEKPRNGTELSSPTTAASAREDVKQVTKEKPDFKPVSSIESKPVLKPIAKQDAAPAASRITGVGKVEAVEGLSRKEDPKPSSTSANLVDVGKGAGSKPSIKPVVKPSVKTAPAPVPIKAKQVIAPPVKEKVKPKTGSAPKSVLKTMFTGWQKGGAEIMKSGDGVIILVPYDE